MDGAHSHTDTRPQKVANNTSKAIRLPWSHIVSSNIQMIGDWWGVCVCEAVWVWVSQRMRIALLFDMKFISRLTSVFVLFGSDVPLSQFSFSVDLSLALCHSLSPYLIRAHTHHTMERGTFCVCLYIKGKVVVYIEEKTAHGTSSSNGSSSSSSSFYFSLHNCNT